MYGQKSIALINDVTGFSRCSVAVELPILSTMKINCCFIPTSILSSNTQVDGFYFDDYTDKIPEFIHHWKAMNLQFDAIATGFLGSTEQINMVFEFINEFKTKDMKIYVDPVMGDNGVLYATYTDDMCNKMIDLVKQADVIFPNLTEACRLLQIPYPAALPSDKELLDILENLHKLGPDQIVITGIVLEDEILNLIYEDHTMTKYIVKRIGGNRSGCGDAFAAVMIGCLMNDMSLYESVKVTTEFLEKTIQFNEDHQVPWNYGLCFEEYLSTLGEKIK